MYGTPSDEIVSLRDEHNGGADTIIPIHDPYSVDNYIETQTLIDIMNILRIYIQKC